MRHEKRRKGRRVGLVAVALLASCVTALPVAMSGRHSTRASDPSSNATVKAVKREASSPGANPDDPWRPLTHYTPGKNWMNDPNGLVYHDGEYHLFYQYNPQGSEWGNMSWGHAVSSDLVHWKELDVALRATDRYAVFSGSAVVDSRNTTGFGRNGKPAMVAVWTRHETVGGKQKQSQSLAYSTDRGRTWSLYNGGAPVLDIGAKDFRDPKVFWDEAAGRWTMAVALSEEHKVSFYSSPDLKNWTHQSDFGPAGDASAVWECPDLFPMQTDGDPAKKRWVLTVNASATAQYFVGDWDGKAFTARTPAAYDGSYSLWGYGNADTWLTAYVGEALIELQKHDQLLNPSQLGRLLKNLRENTDGSYNAERAHSDSYTYYTLAYAGEPVRGNLLRYHREAGDKLDRNDSLDIAVALALLGEYQAASERLATVAAVENSNSYPYSSTTSLAAHNLVRLKQLETLWQNVKNDPQNTGDTLAKLYDEQREALAQALSHDRYLSTQELAWLVRLATVAPKLAADTAIEINGKAATLADLEKAPHNGKVRITNPGKQPLWLSVRDLHAPAAAEASSEGWEIALRYENADGTVLDPAKLPNNTDIRITATFTPKLDRETSQSDLVYTYPLPAGITLSALRDDNNSAMEPGDDDEDRVNYQYRENRDDRHIAAFTLNGAPKAFSYTIHGRTTRAGTWHAPGASIENMYHPEEHARQAAQQIVVQ